MSVSDDIKAILQQVPTLLGEVWQYRQRTSKRDAAPTFGAWTDFDALALDQVTNAEEVENGEDVSEAMNIRMSWNIPLAIGDQVKQPVTDKVFHVRELIGSGIGTQRFVVERSHRDQFGATREGGFA